MHITIGKRATALSAAAATLICGVPGALTAHADEAATQQVVAQAFQLEGESDVNNIKINWPGESGITYTIARAESGNGATGEFTTVKTDVKGSSWDDYDLKTGTAYVYQVTASSGAVGESNTVATFKAPSGLTTYSNTGANTYQGKSGFKVDDTYYRYDAVSSDGNVDIVEYTSSDDVTWSEPRTVISHSQYSWLTSAKLESFSAIYNESAKKVDIWAHWENNADYTEAKVFSANGTPGKDDFTSTEPYRPQGNESRDLSVYVDGNSAYLISTTNNNADQIIYTLNDDWTGISDKAGVTVNKGLNREAPSLVHYDGWYYLFTSGTNGWYPTQGQVISAKSIAGLADAQPQLIGNSQTYGAQSGGAVTVGNDVMIAANRWSGGWTKPDPALNGAWSSQRMLPVAFNNGYAAYNYYAQVKYSTDTNAKDAVVVPVQSGRNLTANATILADQTTEAGQNADAGWTGDAANAIDGLDDENARQYIPSGDGAYTWTADLGKLSSISQVDIDFHEVRGSDTYAQYQIKGSTDGVNYVVLADKSSNTIPGFNETLIDANGQYRYLQIAVSATKRVKDDASAETWWQRGFKEVRVYGSQTNAEYDGNTYTGVPVGEEWYDTSGNAIQAHGGGFLQEQDANGNPVYYWVGEDKSHNSANFKGVNLYKSTDMLNWTKVDSILTEDSAKAAGAEYGLLDVKMERPKILKNSDGKYVVWAHWEDATGYTSSQIAVATADKIEGPYTFQGHWRPGAGADAKYRNWRAVANGDDLVYITDADYAKDTDNGGKAITDSDVWAALKADAITDKGFNNIIDESDWSETPDSEYGQGKYGYGSRDMTLYQEGDDAYIVTAEDYQQMRIHKLNADLTDVAFTDASKTEETMTYRAFQGKRLEAPALMKHDGTYYLIMSTQSGWYPNQARYYTSTDLSNADGWSGPTLIGNNSTFYSQPTSIMTVNANGKNSYIYLGDRWQPDRLGSSTYIWLPLTFGGKDGKTLTMDYTPGWKLNTKTGDIEYAKTVLVSQGKAVYADPRSDGKTDAAYAATNANDGDYQIDSWWDENKVYYAQDHVPFTWTVDLGQVYDLSRVDLSFPLCGGSEAKFGYIIKGTNTPIGSLDDAKAADWTVLADQRDNQTVGFKSDRVSGKYQYVQIEVTSAINVHNGNSVADWLNGLIEAQVYANTGTGELAALPTADLKSGTYTSDQKVTLTSTDQDAVIHYTTDGSKPTADSAVFDAAKPIALTKGTTTVKAIAVVDGKETSGVASWTYKIIDPNDITGLQDGQTTAFAITPDEGASGLPATLKAVSADGKNKDDAAVTWNTDGVDLSTPYTQTSVTGTMAGGYTVNATVAVAPKNLVFFIDSGTKPAETATGTSAYFEAAKAKFGDQLLNAQSDQKFDEASGWGYTGKVGDPNNSDATMGIRNGDGIDDNGWYGSGSKAMTYSLTLPAGAYTLTTGHQEWWTATRDMKVDVTVDGKTETKDVHVDKTTPHAEAAFELTLDKKSKVDVSVHESGAVMAWIGVAGKAKETVAVDKSKLQDKVDTINAEKLDESKYTADSWGTFAQALANAQAVLDDANATQQQVDDAARALTQARQDLAPIDNEGAGTGDGTGANGQQPGGNGNANGGVQGAKPLGNTGTAVTVIAIAVMLLAGAGVAFLRLARKRE